MAFPYESVTCAGLSQDPTAVMGSLRREALPFDEALLPDPLFRAHFQCRPPPRPRAAVPGWSAGMPTTPLYTPSSHVDGALGVRPGDRQRGCALTGRRRWSVTRVVPRSLRSRSHREGGAGEAGQLAHP